MSNIEELKQNIARLVQLQFAVHKVKDPQTEQLKEVPDVYVQDFPGGKMVVSWSEKAADHLERELAEFDKRYGACYVITGDGEIIQDSTKFPAPLKTYWMECRGRAEAGQQMPTVVESGRVATVQQSKSLPSTPIDGKTFMQKIGDSPVELVITLGDKRYATKYGRWMALHMSGRRIRSSKPTILQTPWQKGEDLKFKPGNAVIRHTLILDNGTPEGEVYEALGEASPDNVSSMIYNDDPKKLDKYGKPLPIVNNLLHMAETKAKNRAIGDATAGGWFIGKGTPPYDVRHVEGCSAEEIADFTGIHGESE